MFRWFFLKTFLWNQQMGFGFEHFSHQLSWMIENIGNFFEFFSTYHFFRLFCVDETNQKEAVGSCVLVTLCWAVKSSANGCVHQFNRHVICKFIERIALRRAVRVYKCVWFGSVLQHYELIYWLQIAFWNTWYEIHLDEMWSDAQLPAILLCLLQNVYERMFKHENC